jgi:hypothetical protein
LFDSLTPVYFSVGPKAPDQYGSGKAFDYGIDAEADERDGSGDETGCNCNQGFERTPVADRDERLRYGPEWRYWP